MKIIERIPETHRKDIHRAVEILRGGGCSQVFLFGSLASGGATWSSDIDIAVRGCPTGTFFHLLGKLMLELDHQVDLVSLDYQDGFARHLEEEGELYRIG
jgi:predicted nucleotidyltransferase